ncbi:fluoride efflux transporter CrcB [Streptomyces sp. WAC 06738]|uniref:fluoride efflux transporter CrcB n=1 Tax=Streptomyces sp. WAC 06738 TaxID=2203210 RepID=UPI000F6F0984|nr:fluoride efflux transporter CrcB [Streptomyces sp. WAC 06738]AZM50806.1 fluoride efflux transporter CrcB [Streptomyces sp. WAC 06738]
MTEAPRPGDDVRRAHRAEPIDPDVEVVRPVPAEHRWRGQGAPVAMVALGGGLGSAARYGAGLLWPTEPAAFPWTTLLVNVVGCVAIGVLMVLITEARTAHRLVRPFLGAGVLGGFTTFSTYAVDVQRLVAEEERAAAGVAYLVLTPVAALAAVWAAQAVTRRAVWGPPAGAAAEGEGDA